MKRENRMNKRKRTLQELTIKDNFMFGAEKYRYTQKKICSELPGLSMEDVAHTIFFSTKGNDEEEISAEMVRFLKFVEAPLSESEQDFEDDYVRKLQHSIKKVKESREMGAKYMRFEEYLNEEREEGLYVMAIFEEE